MELFALSAIIFYALAVYQSILIITEKKALQTRPIFIFSAIAALSHLFWVGFEVVTQAGLNFSITNVAAIVSVDEEEAWTELLIHRRSDTLRSG